MSDNKLIKILNAIDEAISRSWDNRYNEARKELFNLRELVCEMIQESQRKKGGRK